MKKTVFSCILALFTLTGVFSQQQQPVVAVAPFEAKSGVSAEDAANITTVFYIRLGNTKSVRLVDRTVVERVIREHNFQAGDWSDREKTAALGKALNAGWIVRGEIVNWRSSTLVTVQFFDITTFEYMGGTDIQINIDKAYEEIQPLVDKLVEAIGGGGAGAGGSAQAQSGKAYQIGDRGPAGGIVFYDKGVFSNGWRYLEAAPHDLGPVQWGAYQQTVGGTEAMVGSGKQNTDRIVAQLKKTGESNRAAQLCADYDVNGYKDWFLPSKDELNLMYQNLKQKGLGGFSNVWYWSSSEGDSNLAWRKYFSDGVPLSNPNGNKATPNWVRAIRAF